MAFDINTVLNTTFANNTGKDYLVFLAIFLVLYLILKIFKNYLLGRIKVLTLKTASDIDDVVVLFIEQFSWIFYVIVALAISLHYLTLPAVVKKGLQYVVGVVVIFYVVKGIQAVIDYYLNKEVQKRKKENGESGTSFIHVLGTITKGILWLIAGLMILSNMNINVSSLIAGLGIGGIAIAFALQNILEDIFSSFSIYFDKPFIEGDFIVIGNDMGVVKHIGIKTTRIQTLHGQELIVSNRELTSTRVNNYKNMKKRRVVFTFGVEYSTPVKKLKKANDIVKTVIKDIKIATLDRVHFKVFGDFSLNYEVVYYVDSKEYNVYMDTQQEINLKIKEAFDKEGIVFAFPTQTVHVVK